jgi:hypothetical protein
LQPHDRRRLQGQERYRQLCFIDAQVFLDRGQAADPRAGDRTGDEEGQAGGVPGADHDPSPAENP